ncbi:hypothetical protein JTE90_000013 [Oedothorax gibbosus]|uniref:HTH psq-type domain-containing protein n=1 Tax=Oedothorax gibbosus TaxID=931172 RepID=A0AAV6TXC3_9ARAC|nr:hypothetical protein JTE90_000013 [Oedothorax gibbosus]
MARIRNKKYKKNAAVRAGNIKKAAKKISGEMSFRKADAVYTVSKSTLNRHIRTLKKSEQPNLNFKYVSKIQSRKVFTNDEEEKLVDYMVQASKYHYGLTINDARTLAYEYASANKKNFPLNWEQEQKAGKEWYIGFKRHSKVFSLRKPEATSLSRATSFTRDNVNKFYDNLESILKREKFTPSEIYNLDESGITTVHVPPKVNAGKGIKQKGVYVEGGVKFIEIESQLRTDRDLSSFSQEDHHVGKTPLYDIRSTSFGLVSKFPLDVMHLVDLGVVRKLLMYWIRKGEKTNINSTRISQKQVDAISAKLIAFAETMPSEFSRKPRSLKDIDRWKATEFRQFVLYLGPVVLQRVLPREASYAFFMPTHCHLYIIASSFLFRRGVYFIRRTHFEDFCRRHEIDIR